MTSGRFKPMIMGALPLFALYIAFIITILIMYSHQVENFRIEKTSNLRRETDLITGIYQRFSDFLYDNSIKKSDAAELLYESWKNPEKKDKNRVLLKKQMDDIYSEIKKYAYRQLHFHLPDTESFLRMHRPEKYGDILKSVRETVAAANLYKKTVSGFEEGRIFNGYRYIYPLFYKDIHSGSVEISISFNAVIEALKRLFKKEYIFMLKKEVVDEKVFESEQSNYETSFLSGSYVMDKEISVKNYGILKGILNRNSRALKNLNTDFSSGQDFIYAFENSGKNILLIAVKLENFKKDHVGYLISIEKSDEYIHLKKDTAQQLFLLSIIILLLFCLIEYHIWVRIKMKELAMRDKLTSLYNRHMFLEILNQTISRMKRYNINSVLIIADIDHFKEINDNYGHNKGDSVLKQFAEILNRNIRESDTSARWGGEEFVILLPNTNIDDGINIAEKIRGIIEQSDFNIGKTITCSFGVAEIKPEDSDKPVIIEKADKMLYKAKKNGRNRVESFKNDNITDS